MMNRLIIIGLLIGSLSGCMMTAGGLKIDGVNGQPLVEINWGNPIEAARDYINEKLDAMKKVGI